MDLDCARFYNILVLASADSTQIIFAIPDIFSKGVLHCRKMMAHTKKKCDKKMSDAVRGIICWVFKIDIFCQLIRGKIVNHVH